MKIWHQGTISDNPAGRVSLLDHGLLYGDGVFEGIRITRGRVFRLEQHLRRLQRSAHAIGLSLPLEKTQLGAAVLETARAFGEQEAYVRILVTRGEGELGIDPTQCDAPQLFCIVSRIRMFPDDANRLGLRLMTSARRRPPLDVLDPQVKSLNYLNNVMARRDARLSGFDDAVLLSASGTIAEASGANLFMVSDGQLLTPPASDGALPGITRAALLEAATQAGIPSARQSLSCYELINADEAFLSGSGAGLVPIHSLDHHTIGSTSRPVFDQLRDAWQAIAERDGTAFMAA